MVARIKYYDRSLDKLVADSNTFLKLPHSAQALYFHLLARADEKGYVVFTDYIIENANCTENDYKKLETVGFIEIGKQLINTDVFPLWTESEKNEI